MAVGKGQFGLASNVYGAAADVTGLVDAISWIPGPPISIVHQCANTTSHPTKFLGRGPATLVGTIQLKATDERTFIADVQAQTAERHAIWLDSDGTEVYCHVWAGQITSREVLQPYLAPAVGNLVRVSFKFVCADQRLYKVSDNSVLLGG